MIVLCKQILSKPLFFHGSKVNYLIFTKFKQLSVNVYRLELPDKFFFNFMLEYLLKIDKSILRKTNFPPIDCVVSLTLLEY